MVKFFKKCVLEELLVATKRRRSLGNVCKHRSMERSVVKCFHYTHVFDLTNLKGEKRRTVGKLNNKLSIVNQLKLPIDAFYRENRSGVNTAKCNTTTGLFGLRKRKKIYNQFAI
jgi:hypothetical protein